MKRWAAFGMFAGSLFVLSGSCQGPDAFYPSLGPGSGGPGVGGSGFGGFIGSGVGGFGVGGFIGAGVGGRGTGGAIGTGGRGMGGATGIAGATGVAGTTGTAGMTGADGGVGTGGRIVDAGSGCIGTLIANNYAAGTAPPCSQCVENGVSLTTRCTAMIDCLAPSCTGGNCYTNCLHSVSGSGPLDGCVMRLVSAACAP